jgi:hypothetical protein
VSTIPSIKNNFINVNLAKILQVPRKHIQIPQVEGENVQFFNYLKIIMDKYVLQSYFHAIDMDDVDIVLGYLWTQLIQLILMCKRCF